MNRKVHIFYSLAFLTVFFILFSGLSLGRSNDSRRLAFTLIAVLITLGLIVAVKRLSHKTWFVLAVILLVLMFIPATTAVRLLPNDSIQPFSGPLSIVLLLIPTTALIVVALLTATAINRPPTQQKARNAQLLLALLLLAKALHSIYWHFIWDSTYDALGILWFFILFPGIVVGGFVLLIALPGKAKLAAGGYLLAVPLLVIGAALLAWQVDFRELTDARAGRVSRAIETYHQRNGRYPHTLAELTPWTTFSVSEPVILFGQDWCYDSGRDYFRLGYVDRAHWSDPRLTGHIHASAGDTSTLPRLCEEEVNAFITAHPDYYVWLRE